MNLNNLYLPCSEGNDQLSSLSNCCNSANEVSMKMSLSIAGRCMHDYLVRLFIHLSSASFSTSNFHVFHSPFVSDGAQISLCLWKCASRNENLLLNNSILFNEFKWNGIQHGAYEESTKREQKGNVALFHDVLKSLLNHEHLRKFCNFILERGGFTAYSLFIRWQLIS